MVIGRDNSYTFYEKLSEIQKIEIEKKNISNNNILNNNILNNLCQGAAIIIIHFKQTFIKDSIKKIYMSKTRLRLNKTYVKYNNNRNNLKFTEEYIYTGDDPIRLTNHAIIDNFKILEKNSKSIHLYAFHTSNNNNNKENVFYHITDARNIPSILSYGLTKYRNKLPLKTFPGINNNNNILLY